MLIRAIYISSFMFLFGCSSVQEIREAHSIRFSDIQKIKMGYSVSSELLKAFGKPNEVRIDEQKQDVWIYRDYVYKNFSDRAKFYVNPASGIVTNAIWSPDESTGFSTEKDLLNALIKEGKFICKLSPPPADHHYIPSDGSCHNHILGISYVFLGRDRGIFAIALSQGSDIRTSAKLLEK